MIITIDGPAGAGKSTVARQLADELGFAYLDTGAMYRAMTYAAMQSDIPLDTPDLLLKFCENANLQWELKEIRLNGKEISSQIRTPEVSRNVKYVADHPDIRQLLVNKQRELAAGKNIVCEGRDQGTVAFPDAPLKFFVSASAEIRAKRRVQDLQKRGMAADFETVLREQEQRDQQDRQRPVGRLQQADDAIECSTDGMSIAEVVQWLKEKVHQLFPPDPHHSESVLPRSSQPSSSSSDS